MLESSCVEYYLLHIEYCFALLFDIPFDIIKNEFYFFKNLSCVVLVPLLNSAM